ncbi:hypothetical protein C1N66_00415 [Bacillus cereus]|uniref:Transposase n=1 Tax=Bacillus cereus TaxID=1396 RepID=A0AB73UBH4_BACCE|nr:hypothetical protein [Bacillus cereus]QHV03725.1 hypothetical protein C1N82_10390 [Bacillus cereus]QHV41713.1 hypothetical protein C1N66_00415 [Bacillus cereus]
MQTTYKSFFSGKNGKKSFTTNVLNRNVKQKCRIYFVKGQNYGKRSKNFFYLGLGNIHVETFSRQIKRYRVVR